MSILADVKVSPTTFLLSQTIAETPDVELQVIREVYCEESISPFLWARSNQVDVFRRALDDDGSVERAARLDGQTESSDTSSCLLRVDWNPSRVPFLKAVADHEGAVLRASYGGGGAWDLTVMLNERAALAALHDNVSTDFELERVSSHHRAHQGPSFGLTAEQREAVLAAYHSGYFEIPRDRNLSEVAEDLDISANALSARLRRGFRTLLANTIVE